MLRKLFKALINLLSGSKEESKPPQQQYPSHPQQQYQHHQQQQQQQQWSRPPAGSQHQHVPTKPQRPSEQQHSVPLRPPQHGGASAYNKDQYIINQQNPHYVSLRSRANEEGDAMARCFEESHLAYANGDGARAKELSNKGKEHQRHMGELNQQASEWIFAENNTDSARHEVDLHGLYIKEAITYTDRALQQARARGDTEIHLIVGKGLHSKNGAAKLKPAIEELMQKYQLSAELDPHNAGVLVVQLGSTRPKGVGADEIARRIEQKDDGCIVM